MLKMAIPQPKLEELEAKMESYGKRGAGMNVDKIIEKNMQFKICAQCFGTGNLRAMQMGINQQGKTQRVQDTIVECKKCSGTGLILSAREVQG